METRTAVACCLALTWTATALWSQPPAPLVTVAGVLVAADGRTPVPGRAVRLQPGPDPDGVVQSDRFESALTDEVGHFEFPRTPPGEYQLVVQTAPWVPVTTLPLTLTGRRGDPLKLVLEHHHLVRGRLLDPSGVPVSSRNVTLTMHARDLANAAMPVELTTDEKGSFQTVAFVPSGEVDCGVHLDGVGWLARERQELSLTDCNLGDLRLQSGGGLSGSVVNATTKEPVEGAVVTAYGRSGSPRICVYGVRLKADDEGEFSVGALPPGEYRLTAHCKGYGIVMKRGVHVSTGDLDTQVTLELRPSGAARPSLVR